MSPYEIMQTIIGINMLIISVIGVCIAVLNNDNKK